MELFMLSGICNLGKAEQCLNTGNIIANIERNRPGSGINMKSAEFNISNMKNMQIKSENEILIWWKAIYNE